MNQEQLKPAYDQFFYKSDAGRHFLAAVTIIIDNYHKQAEQLPEFSRDLVQSAKGCREVLNHITSVTTVMKKGKSIE